MVLIDLRHKKKTFRKWKHSLIKKTQYKTTLITFEARPKKKGTRDYISKKYQQ